VRARRNRVLAWVATGVLILSMTFAGMIIRFGPFQGPDTAATTPAGITSTVSSAGQTGPLGPVAPAANGPFGNGAAQGDGMGDGGLQGRTSSVTRHAVSASTALNGASVRTTAPEE
jgi:hypothetical protein